MKRNTMLVLIVCTALLFTAAFSTVYRSTEFFHRCNNSGSCTVCSGVRQCVSFLSQLLRPAIMTLLLLVPVLLLIAAAMNGLYRPLQRTLVSLKVLLLI